MNILIFEPEHGGHRLSGVRVLIEALLDLDVEFNISVASTTESFQSEEFKEQLGHLTDRIEAVPLYSFMHGSRNFLRIALRKHQLLLKLAATRKWQHIYVPYGDGLIYVSSVLQFIPGFKFPKNIVLESILMRCTVGYPAHSGVGLYSRLFLIRFSSFSKVHLIDPIPYEYIKKNHPVILQKVALLPDPISETPVMDRVFSRETLGLPLDARIIGCVGRIDRRKGSNALVKAFADAKRDPGDILLLAGKHSSELARMVEQSGDKSIISIDRYLTEEELFQVFSALDVVATTYRSDFVGSASIAIRAASAGRMCLGSDKGWTGLAIPKFGLGNVCDVDDPVELSTSISESLRVSNDFQLGEFGKKFVAYSSLENVRASWTVLIRSIMGIDQNPSKLGWPDIDK